MSIDLFIELTGAMFSLLYLWLEIRQRQAMWVVGMVSAVFYVVIFYHGKFYADMGLNVYYMLASVYGLVVWQKGSFGKKTAGADRQTPAVARTSPRIAVRLLAVAVLLFVGLTFVLLRFTDSPVACGDALTTALSIVAMWMLAHKLIEQWGVWFVVNVLSMGLYCWRGLYPTAILFLVYSVASVIGYYQWKKNS